MITVLALLIVLFRQPFTLVQKTDIFQELLHLVTLFNLYFFFLQNLNFFLLIFLVMSNIELEFRFRFIMFLGHMKFLFGLILAFISAIIFIKLNLSLFGFGRFLGSYGCLDGTVFYLFAFFLVIFVRSIDLFYEFFVLFKFLLLHLSVVFRLKVILG